MTAAGRLREWVALSPGPTDWLGGARLTCAFLLPIAVGLAVNQEMTGLFIGIGAFIVANADLGESFGQRARLMIPTTLAVAALTGLGMATGLTQWLGVAVGAVIFFAGAVFGATGREAMIFGTFGSIAFIVGVGITGAPGLNELQVVLSLLGGGALALLLSALHMLFNKPLPDEEPEPWSRHCRPASGPG